MKFLIALTVVLSVATPSTASYQTTHPSDDAGGRAPTYDDFQEILVEVEGWINDSSCPDVPVAGHWNGPDPDDTADCIYFKRVRNPDSLGSRLVRHAFHDSAGGLDGFVDIDNLAENGGLDASDFVLREIYGTFSFSDGTPVSKVLSLADLTAWAGHVAVVNAAKRVNGNQNLSEDDEIPPIPVRWGRLDYAKEADWDAVAEGVMPKETFPQFGGSSTGNDIFDYFALNFGLTEKETVTLMGVHTFGGARRVESGYTGMWTQSKNKFNNDYQKGMLNPTPLDCPIDAGGIDGCTLLEDDDGNCLQEGRCEGWEQMPIRNGRDGTFGRQFQWRHSCTVNGTEDNSCTHIMLNADMGLFLDLEAHVCKEDGEATVLGEPCRRGQVKSFPASSTCDITDENQRILASCFEEHDTYAHHIIDDATDMSSWIQNFGPVYDVVLSHTNPALGVTLQELTSAAPTAAPTASPTTAAPTLVPNGSVCPCTYEELVHGNEKFDCPGCGSGSCQKRKNQAAATCVRSCNADGRSCSSGGDCCSGACLGDSTCAATA